MSDPGQNIRVLEMTITDGIIDGRLKRGQENVQIGMANGKFEPTRDQERFIEFFIDQLKFLVDKDILASDTVLSNAEKKKKALTLLAELVTFLGEYLYRVLFTGEIEDLLNTAMIGDPKLLRIQIEFRSDSKKYADWPWEYLYQPPTSSRAGRFVAKETNLMLVRRLTLDGETPEMKTRKPNVLLIISQPNGYDVQCENLLKTLNTLKDEGSIDLLTLQKVDDPKRPPKPNVTYEHLCTVIENNSFDIIHFVGHGRCTGDRAELALVDASGNDDWRNETSIAYMINLAKQKPKLVFLQACESALPDTYRGVSGVARALAQNNIPAVVAMQYKIMNSIANNFAVAFYEQLATGLSVDQAVQAGRKAINKFSNDDDFQYHAFGLPVLYLRSYDSIFEPKVLPDSLVASAALQSASAGKREIICTYAPGSCPAPNLGADETVCYNCGCDLFCPACHEPLKRPQGNFCQNPKCKHRLTPEPPGATQKQDLPANGTPKQPETQVITPGTYVPAIGLGRG
ncbi:MAG TPA: CHAT domain-containing protein [Ktedonobacteraceae bacterium]|nr:CHAT domain-containing protein [Ktedonobacteraceae bacterium]